MPNKSNNSREDNYPETRKAYAKKNKKKIAAWYKQYYEENKEEHRERSRNYYKKNRKKVRKQQKAYKSKYKEIINKRRREAFLSNPALRIIANLRNRINRVIKGKSKLAEKTLGCSREHFLKHLEVQFKRGMTWKNYGTHWHVDHHIPVCAHDQSNKKEFEACWHFSNLKPMWKKDNLRKGSKICLER